MFGHVYFHDTIRKYAILFGTLFNDIYIKRTRESDGETVNMLRVPISYAPKDKTFVRTFQDPNTDQPFSVILPRMSFQMLNFNYDGSRKLNTLNRHVGTGRNNDMAAHVYSPVPYDFYFELYIGVKNIEDGTRILEQILPFFTPDWTTRVRLLDSPEVIMDIPLELKSNHYEDTWEGNYETRRSIIWTLGFVMKGYLFGPVNQSRIIKKAKTHIGSSTTEGIYLTNTIRPGLTAGGVATTDPDETLPYSDISWDDDYGFVSETEVYPYGRTIEEIESDE